VLHNDFEIGLLQNRCIFLTACTKAFERIDLSFASHYSTVAGGGGGGDRQPTKKSIQLTHI